MTRSSRHLAIRATAPSHLTWRVGACAGCASDKRSGAGLKKETYRGSSRRTCTSNKENKKPAFAFAPAAVSGLYSAAPPVVATDAAIVLAASSHIRQARRRICRAQASLTHFSVVDGCFCRWRFRRSANLLCSTSASQKPTAAFIGSSASVPPSSPFGWDPKKNALGDKSPKEALGSRDLHFAVFGLLLQDPSRWLATALPLPPLPPEPRLTFPHFAFGFDLQCSS